MKDRANREPPTPNKMGRVRARGLRWLSILMGASVVLVAGVVAADVVLVYSDSNTINGAASNPFAFTNGGNYATAHSYSFITTSYTGGTSTSGPEVATTVSGITDVTVQLYDVVEFDTAATITSPTAIGDAVGLNAPTTVTNVLCAYAFVSTALPSLGSTGVSGAPAGCSVTVPALGSVSAGCQTAAVMSVNLLTGAALGTLAGDCTVPTSTASGATVLYISYGIVTTGSVSSSGLATLTIPVALS